MIGSRGSRRSPRPAANRMFTVFRCRAASGFLILWGTTVTFAVFLDSASLYSVFGESDPVGQWDSDREGVRFGGDSLRERSAAGGCLCRGGFCRQYGSFSNVPSVEVSQFVKSN
jgi:hypothetical protein